jgi:RHS repeat-associated protein
LIATTDRNGRKRTYNYDALNRETAEHWLDNLGNDVRTFNYHYDAVGHLLVTNDPDSKYTYSYDLADRITSVDNLGTIGVPNVLLDYSYDAAGNLLNVTDKINGVLNGTNAYTYDLLNRVTRITQSGTGVQNKRVDMSYDAASQMTGLNRYGDLAGTLSVADTSYTYDLAGRLTNLTHQHGGNTVASYGLVYDVANRITRSAGTDGVQDYSYDSTNQLTGADHTTIADEAYSYDANGNRTNAGYGTGTNNQLLTDGIYNYSYDGEGNRTLRVEIATGKVTEYLWDYRNRLTGVLFKDGAGVVTRTIEYRYDVNDRRIGKRIDGVTTERYVYDGSDVALVFDGAGVQTHRYLHGTGVDTVLADERGGTVVWALGDNQGTVRDVLDGNGVVLNHVSYDSFGKVVGQSNAGVEFRYGFTGRETDGETGLDYYRARYYDSASGRFISEDPLGFGAGDANLSRYVGNSPTNWNDPSGKCLVFAAPAIPTALPWLIGGFAGFVAGLNALNDAGFNPFTNRAPDPNFDLSPSPPPFPAPHNPLHLDDYRPEIFPNHGGDLLPPLGGIDLTPVWTNHHTGGGYQDHSRLPQYVFNTENIPTDDMWNDLAGINNPSYDPRPTTPGGRKLSEHADVDSLNRHGFSEPYHDVDNIIDSPSRVTQQADGAKVYIQSTGNNNYNLAIVNHQDNSLVTAMQNLTGRELSNLGKRYGFNANP